MSSSSAKKKVSCLSPKKKDSLNKEDTTITSPKKRLSVKKRRTTEIGSVPIPENDVKEEDATVLQVKLLSENAIAPTRHSELAAGYDLASAYEYVVPARGRMLVQSDVAVAIPVGCYGRIAPRSGLAVKHGIGTGAGVIDADYRGSIGVLLFNHSDTDFEVKKGDRVAQLILERVAIPKVEVVAELPETERGDNGFGSTGIAADSTNAHTDN